MSITDRNARAENRRFIEVGENTTAESLRGRIQGDNGVTIDKVRGAVPSQRQGVPDSQGVASPYPSYGDDPVVIKCHATTKKGDPCKAAPITDEQFCVGHMRARDAAGVN